MRIALISLYDLENNAVRILADFLRRRGHQALEIYFKDWKNNHFSPPTPKELQDLADGIRNYRADLVGFSLRASAYLAVCMQLAQYLREELDLPIILGGVHPTLCAESSITIADYLVLGEAEQTIKELMDRMEQGQSTHDLPNIWVRQGDKVFRNEVRPLVQDLADISRRDFLHPHKLVIDGAIRSSQDPMLIDTMYQAAASRGCPFHCSFCYNSSMRGIYKGKGRYTRLRTPADVIAELKQAKQIFRKMKRVRFDDEVFPYDLSWLEEFLGRYQAEIGVPFSCFLDPRTVHEDHLRMLSRAGLDIVYMGIQANDRVCKTLYGRKATNEAVRDAAYLFKKYGINPRYQVMVDDPETAEEDWRALFELLNSLPRPFHIYLFSMTVMPGTALEQDLLRRGLITPDEVEGAATKTFSQYRVSLEWDRDPLSLFWLSMIVLVTKPGFSRERLSRLSHSRFFRRHPRALARIASLANALSMVERVPIAFLNGEVPSRALRHFWNPGNWITA